MKNKFGKILGLLFLLNLLFFIGTSLFFTNNDISEKSTGSVFHLHSSSTNVEGLSLLAENIEIDEEELDEANKFTSLELIDLNNVIFQIALFHHFISKITLDSHQGNNTAIPVHKLHCVYLI